MNGEIINYNLLLEFHSFLSNLARYDGGSGERRDFSEPDSFVRKLIDGTYADLSPITKADLHLLFRDTVLISHTIVSPDLIGKVGNYREFREILGRMDADEYIRLFILSASDTEAMSGSEESTIEEIEEQFRQMETGDTIIESYRELKKYPEETMSRIRNFLDRFYFEYFEKAEPHIEEFLKEKTARHREIYGNDRKRFEKEIIKASFEDFDGDERDFSYYTGYLNTGRRSYHKEGNSVFCYYNYQYEQLFDPAYCEKQAQEFFKTMADETRFRMLRMMGEKSRYTSEMAEELGINKATVSYHMKMFTRFNIIDISLGKNKRIYYRVRKDNLKNFCDRFVDSL